MNYKFKVIFDDDQREEKLYKTKGDLLADLGYEFGIFNFSTIYRIQKGLLKDKKYPFNIIKIR
jgi:hypothetical protein